MDKMDAIERKVTWAELWKAPKPIEPSHMGHKRVTSMPTVLQERNPGAHPKLLPKGARRRTVPRNRVSKAEEIHPQYHRSGRESIKMAVAQERREVEAIVACHLDTSWGLISPSWVTWRRVYDVERPETPDDSRNITEDVSRCIDEH
ncbi:hypothetical protein NQZ68_008641 [Dissostichus eleginoides]|nr:hypothetical protein NQZ68_008641 [Dissostichus eleginoides]